MCKRQYPQTQKALFISPADLDVDCWAVAEKRPEPVIPRAACDSARSPSCSTPVCWPLLPPCSLRSPSPYHSTPQALQNKRRRQKRMCTASKGKTTVLLQVSHKGLLSPYWFTYALCAGGLFKGRKQYACSLAESRERGKREAIVQMFENERTNCKILVVLSGAWTKAGWHAILPMTDGTKFTVCSGEADRKSRAMKGMRNVGNAITTRQSFRARAPAWH